MTIIHGIAKGIKGVEKSLIFSVIIFNPSAPSSEATSKIEILLKKINIITAHSNAANVKTAVLGLRKRKFKMYNTANTRDTKAADSNKFAATDLSNFTSYYGKVMELYPNIDCRLKYILIRRLNTSFERLLCYTVFCFISFFRFGYFDY